MKSKLPDQPPDDAKTLSRESYSSVPPRPEARVANEESGSFEGSFCCGLRLLFRSREIQRAEIQALVLPKR